MKHTSTLLVLMSLAAASLASAADIYHLTLFKAAPGKAAALGADLKAQGAKAPMPGHILLLRHSAGDDWDYAMIEHMGPKATIDANAPAPPPGSRDLITRHDDTFVIGPAWADFAKEMGIGQTNTAGWVYVVATHQAIAGHREQLEKLLRTPRVSGATQAGAVVLSHIEGGAWNFLAIDSYKSWQDYATSESKSQAETLKGAGGWYDIREHLAFHRDTVTHRVAP